MRVVVVGATGVLGRWVVPLLVARGHDVRPVVRTTEAARRLAAEGLKAAEADILDAGSLVTALDGAEVVVNVATSIPRPGPNQDWQQNDRIRREGTANLIAACGRSGTRKVVQQSIAFLVPSTGADFVDEASPVVTAARTESAAEVEDRVARSELDWTVLRGGAFYGPGTGRDETWRSLAREGRLQVPGEGDDFISLIHVKDMAEATVAATTSATGNVVLNIVDDEPVTYETLFAHIAHIEDAPAPPHGGPPLLPSFRARNTRARAALGWRPHVATYRSGLAPAG